jgi:hypothetical protein
VNQDDRSTPERLLAAQCQDPKLKLTYQQDIDAMLNQTMPAPARWLLAAFTVILLLAAIHAVLLLARGGWDDTFQQELLIPALVFELAMAGGLAWITWRGRSLRTIHGFFAAFLLGNFSLFAWFFLNDTRLFLAPPEMQEKFVWISRLVLVLGWLPLALVVNSHYHERTREKLLEIQYQIAELTEEIKKRK